MNTKYINDESLVPIMDLIENGKDIKEEYRKEAME